LNKTIKKGEEEEEEKKREKEHLKIISPEPL
jgi:hypothetical protein